MGISIAIYIISAIILLILFRMEQKPLLLHLICFFPVCNSLLVLLLMAILIIKWAVQENALKKIERDSLFNIDKMKAQGIHVVLIDGKEYRVTKEELFK